ncbi:MAG TPA: ATP-binding protein [bacterium]|nr:ATP-binding protein [bacterium]
MTRRARSAGRTRASSRSIPPAVWEDVRRAVAAISVLRDVLDDPVGRTWREVVAAVAAASPDPAIVAAAHARLFSLIAREAEFSADPIVGDAWQHHLLSRLLDVENAFSQKAERAGWAAIGPALVAQTRADLVVLERCHRLSGTALARVVSRIARVPAASWAEFRPLAADGRGAPRLAMMRRFHAARGWDRLARELAAHFAEHGVGLFGRFRAFRWTRADGRGRLEGVSNVDPIRLDDLVGYELERHPVVENTRQFVAGAPANNVLLYGDRGTGKSSTVKALLNEFGDRGLRVIEVAKDHLPDYPEIVTALRGRRERFVLFVDDLSFEEHETQYKALKAALEGSLEARAENVVLYATSNRRHLVSERFVDRQRASLDDDVHPEDAAQEKLSLADRFGVHAPFLIPDQDRYLEIVAGLAARYDLRVPAGELRRRALVWAQWHNGLSCRTARQFVDALCGEAMLEREARGRGGR